MPASKPARSRKATPAPKPSTRRRPSKSKNTPSQSRRSSRTPAQPTRSTASNTPIRRATPSRPRSSPRPTPESSPRSRSTPPPPPLSYSPVPGSEFGPKWKSTRPPGLPASARPASAQGAAQTAIANAARATRLGDIFQRLVADISQTESGATFGLPANIFDARPQSERPAGRPLITAWGVFQFNRPAWCDLAGFTAANCPVDVQPWNATPEEEVLRPIARYAELFSRLLDAGGTAFDAARGVRVWQITPAGFQKYLAGARSSGDFPSAYLAATNDTDRAFIEKRLAHAGITPSSVTAPTPTSTPPPTPPTLPSPTAPSAVASPASPAPTSAAPSSPGVAASSANTDRKSVDYLRWLQSALNLALGTRLMPDGVAGPKTIAVLRDFQRRNGLVDDGVPGPKTDAALQSHGAPPPPTPKLAPTRRTGGR